MTYFTHRPCLLPTHTEHPDPTQLWCAKCSGNFPISSFERLTVPRPRPILVGSVTVAMRALGKGDGWADLAQLLAFDTEGRGWWLVVRVETISVGSMRHLTKRNEIPSRWQLAEDLPFCWERPENLPPVEAPDHAQKAED